MAGAGGRRAHRHHAARRRHAAGAKLGAGAGGPDADGAARGGDRIADRRPCARVPPDVAHHLRPAAGGGMMPAFWRRTPPVLFPACLGALGLGLGWRRAAEALGAPGAIGEAVLAVAGAVFLFAFTSYAAKVLRRPGV